MSKYTIELGLCLENYLELRDKNIDNYKQIVELSPTAILVREYPDYISSLIKNFVQANYYNELCTYPYAKWRIMLDGVLSKNLPRYDQIYEVLQKDIDLLANIGYTVTDVFEGTVIGDKSSNTQTTAQANITTDTSTKNNHNVTSETTTNTQDETEQYNFDTPMSGTALPDNRYATSASKSGSSGSGVSTSENIGESSSQTDTTSSDNSQATTDVTENNNTSTADSRTTTHSGKSGGDSYQDLLANLNAKALNLTQIFISDLDCLFFALL